MNLKQFNQIRRDYNRIPLVREIFADLDTPLSAYLKLADEPYSYLFESVQGGEKWGRYSIIGLPSETVIKVRGRSVLVERGGNVVEEAEIRDPLAWIEQFQRRFRVPETGEGLPRFAIHEVARARLDDVQLITGVRLLWVDAVRQRRQKLRNGWLDRIRRLQELAAVVHVRRSWVCRRAFPHH